MCQGRPGYSLWLHLVLISVAIQGVTPDSQDLASLNSLFLLCHSGAGSGNLADNDSLPNEVCGPAEPVVDVVLRGMAEPDGPAGHLSFSTGHHDLLTTPIKIRRIGSRHGTDSRLADLICSLLCRFRC
jgi:hypothetical protein